MSCRGSQTLHKIPDVRCRKPASSSRCTLLRGRHGSVVAIVDICVHPLFLDILEPNITLDGFMDALRGEMLFK